jgi:hypothetical protein
MVKSKSRNNRMMILTKQFSNKFIRLVKNEGLGVAITKVNSRISTKLGLRRYLKKDYSRLSQIYTEVQQLYKLGEIKGVCFLPSALEFEELYNQRTINLAKYLSENGYFVLFISWQWEENQKLDKEYQKVYQNIYEIPMYDFIYSNNLLSKLNMIESKIFISTLPAKVFYKLIPNLKSMKFTVVYDILDEWEEFFKVGQASWFEKEIEERFVSEANHIFAVSEPLKQKFSNLKSDIHVIGNGYNPELSKKANISLKTKAEDGKIHIGYFGHMTDAWFDWELILHLLKNDNITIHLIGHGAPKEILESFNNHKNAKFYGKVHPSELYKIIEKWHIGIIPFKHIKLSEAVDPIKIYEYLFFGLPTVSTGIPHIGRYPNVYHCNSYDEVSAKIESIYEQIISNTLEDNYLKAFLEESTWDNRFNEMLQIIELN